MGHMAGLDVLEKNTNFLSVWGFELRTFKPVTYDQQLECARMDIIRGLDCGLSGSVTKGNTFPCRESNPIRCLSST
jgi:hypothetical protein